MDCLTDYIGFFNCAGQDEPPSGMYINTLPGITLESVDKVATSEQITYLQVWADAQKEAAIRFLNDFKIELNKCFTLSRKCDYEDMLCDNLEHLVVAWRYLLGNQLMLYRLNSTRLNRFTTTDRKQAAELAEAYQADYMQALQLAMKIVDVSGCCQQEPTNNPKSVWWLP